MDIFDDNAGDVIAVPPGGRPTEAGRPGTARPGGRTARTRQAVFAATRALLVEEGAAGMRMESIAARAGVHRSSIYRRWRTPAGIVADLAAEIGAATPSPDTGSLEGDLREVAERLAGQLAGDGAALVRALVGWPDPGVRISLARFWRDRQDDVGSILDRHGSEADPAVVTRLLAGPLHYQAVLEGTDLDGAAVTAAVMAALSVATCCQTVEGPPSPHLVRIRPASGPAEYPALVAIWRSAVDATHDFLAAADRDEIEAHLAPDYLPAVVLSVAEVDGRPVGFAGTLDGALEMLFVDARHRGGGIGSALLDHAVQEHGVTRVDVNEQNPAAAGFYARHGFEVVGRSATDDAGRPYPLLHLRLG